MFNVFYSGAVEGFLVGMFDRKLEAEFFIVNEHEDEMIKCAELGIFENMSEEEKVKYYEDDRAKYSIIWEEL